MTFQFLEFLRRELAPTPGRLQATLRLMIACIACTVPIMAFHLQSPLLVMVGMFIFAKEDTTTTLLGTILGICGVAVGCCLLLLYYVSALDLPWLRVLGIPVFIACGLMINRIITIGPLGYGIAVPMALGMTVPDSVSSVEYLNRYPFYLWSAWTLGLLVNLVVQYLMNPQKTQSVLIRGLTTRLDAVEGFSRRLIAEEKPDSKPSAIAEFALMGVVEPLHQLKMAGAIEPWLKKNHAKVRAQFILVDRLVTAAAVLEFQGIGSSAESVKKRLQQVANACARWRTAINNHRPPEIFIAAVESGSATSEQEALPSLAEMERVIELMPFTFPGRELPEELKPAPNQDKGGVLVPDAFTNPEYIQFAIKGALSGFICYLIFTLTSYPGIYNAVITSIVCSLTTIGASLQKGTLRFAGAAVGGALGLVSLMYIFPHLDTLGGFWFPFGAATALAAYVNFGSPRIAYCGFQISLAFNKCVLQGYGPYTELRVVRDRLIGIVLGLVVFGFINNHLWPVKALNTTRAKLASILRLLAKLADLPDGNNHAPQMAEAYTLRLQMYQDHGTLRQLFESSKFEPGALQRERLEAMDNTAQMLFLHQLAIIQHRPDIRPSAVPEPLRAASAKFRATLAEFLLNTSDRVNDKSERPVPDLPSALVELEQAVAAQIKTVTDANIVRQIRARLTLYQETVPIAMKLTRLQAA